MPRVKPCAEKWVINRDELGTFPAPREPQTVVDTDQWSIWSGVSVRAHRRWRGAETVEEIEVRWESGKASWRSDTSTDVGFVHQRS